MPWTHTEDHYAVFERDGRGHVIDTTIGNPGLTVAWFGKDELCETPEAALHLVRKPGNDWTIVGIGTRGHVHPIAFRLGFDSDGRATSAFVERTSGPTKMSRQDAIGYTEILRANQPRQVSPMLWELAVWEITRRQRDLRKLRPGGLWGAVTRIAKKPKA